MADTSTPLKAREHARAQAGKAAETMPTIPASAAQNLPAHVKPQDVIWDETIPGGGYCSRVLPRGSRLRLTNLQDDACANLLVYNADHPAERLPGEEDAVLDVACATGSTAPSAGVSGGEGSVMRGGI